MIEKIVKKTKDKAVESTKECIEKHSDDIAEFIFDAAKVCLICGIAYSIGQNIIPRRNNVHIYVHLR